MLAEGHALFDLEIEGGKAVPVVVKEQQLHPVRGSLQHIDLQEVKLDEAIQAEVAIELEGAEDAPGVKDGGVLEHVTREITVEALPTEIPDRIVVDVSAMEINDTLQLSAVDAPEGVKFVADDPEEVTIATLSPPRVEEEPEPEVEEETELVGEEGEAPEGEAAGGRAPRATRATPRASSRCRSSAAGPIATSGEPGDRILIVGLGNPGRELRRRPATTSASRSPTELSRRWDLPRAQAEVRRPDRRRARRARRAAGGDPAAADLHERLRRLGRPGARLAEGAARPRRRPPRRDRPPLRRGPGPPRRRPRRPQRPEEPQARLRRRRVLAGPGRGGAARLDRPRGRLLLRALALPRAARRGRGADRPRRRRGRAAGRDS